MIGNSKSASDPPSRLAKEPSLCLRIDGDHVEHVELAVPEPARQFASGLIGKDVREAPEIIQRLWGRCPVSYQLPACEALEAAMGVEVTPEMRQLRRLLYCGEWIESHALHIYLLAPNLVGSAQVEADRVAAERCLRLRCVGDSLVAALSRSATSPSNIAVGGFRKAPRAFELDELRPELEWALGASVEVLRFVASLDLPKLDSDYVDYEMVCLHHPERYPMNEGHVISSRGLVVPVSQYEARFGGRDPRRNPLMQGDWIPRETSYLVGPLARVNMSLHQLAPTARSEAEACGVSWPSGNVFHSLLARAIESVHACEEAIAIIDRYHSDLRVPHVDFEPKAGVGCHAAEAPSGLAYHCYRVNWRGQIADARVVSPADQNRKQAEQDLRSYLPKLERCDKDEAARRCEQLVFNY